MRYHIIALVLISMLSLLAIRPYPIHLVAAENYGPIKEGDIIKEVNGIKVTGINFYRLISNNTVIKIARETLPYVFVEKTFEFKEPNLSTEFKGPNLKLTPYYVKHFKFVLSGDASERLKRAKIYFIKENNKFETTKDIKSLVEDPCNLTVKIGNHSIDYAACKSFECSPFVYQGYIKENENYYLVWKYGFKIHVNSTQFAAATNNSKIGECISGVCYLKDKLTFYLNNKSIGYDLIPVSEKGKKISKVTLVGFANSQEEALQYRNKLLACAGFPAVKVQKVEEVAPKYDIWAHILPALLMPVLSGIILSIAQRKKERIYYSFLFPAYLPVIFLAGMIIPVDLTFVAIVDCLSLLSTAIILYAGYKLKEFHEGEAIKVKRGILKLSITLLILSIILAFWKPVFLVIAPYALLSLIFDRKFIPELMRL